MSGSMPRRNGYCESGFAGKSVHADTIDCWHTAIESCRAARRCWQMLVLLAKRSIRTVPCRCRDHRGGVTAYRAG